MNYIYILTFILSTAYAAVFVNLRFTEVSANLITFVSFLFCWVFFISLNRKRLPMLVSLYKKEKQGYILVNIFSLLSWLGMFWSLKFVSATVEQLTYMSIVPLVTTVLARQWSHINSKSKILIVTINVLSITVAYMHPSMLEIGLNSQMLGVIVALFAGISGAVFIVSSSVIQKTHKLTSIDLICIRFPLLLLVTFILSVNELAVVLSWILIMKLMFLSIIAVILPVYMLQQSITHLGSVKTSILIPVIPAISIFLEWVEGEPITLFSGVFVLLVCVAIALVSRELMLSKNKNIIKEKYNNKRNNEIFSDVNRQE